MVTAGAFFARMERVQTDDAGRWLARRRAAAAPRARGQDQRAPAAGQKLRRADALPGAPDTTWCEGAWTTTCSARWWACSWWYAQAARARCSRTSWKSWARTWCGRTRRRGAFSPRRPGRPYAALSEAVTKERGGPGRRAGRGRHARLPRRPGRATPHGQPADRADGGDPAGGTPGRDLRDRLGHLVGRGALHHRMGRRGNYRFKRGHRNVIAEAMRLSEEDIDCPLAIETSGHAALRGEFLPRRRRVPGGGGPVQGADDEAGRQNPFLADRGARRARGEPGDPHAHPGKGLPRRGAVGHRDGALPHAGKPGVAARQRQPGGRAHQLRPGRRNGQRVAASAPSRSTTR